MFSINSWSGGEGLSMNNRKELNEIRDLAKCNRCICMGTDYKINVFILTIIYYDPVK